MPELDPELKQKIREELDRLLAENRGTDVAMQNLIALLSALLMEP